MVTNKVRVWENGKVHSECHFPSKEEAREFVYLVRLYGMKADVCIVDHIAVKQGYRTPEQDGVKTMYYTPMVVSEVLKDDEL